MKRNKSDGRVLFKFVSLGFLCSSFYVPISNGNDFLVSIYKLQFSFWIALLALKKKGQGKRRLKSKMLIPRLLVFALLTFHLASAFWPFSESSDEENGKICVLLSKIHFKS